LFPINCNELSKPADRGTIGYGNGNFSPVLTPLTSSAPVP
jgi:hypothetical protein